PMVSRLAERVAELVGRDVPGIEVASVAERARYLGELAARFDARVADERARPAGGEPVAALLSGAMLRLSRLLVPITSTVVGPYGQDRYGHAWQSGSIPALGGYEALAAGPADSEQ